MSKTLIITEKPSVAREYAAILGVRGNGNGVIENSEYAITWCVGHLVEMSYPEFYDPKYKKWCLADLPFLPEVYQYDVIENVAKQYDIVKNLMHSDEITEILYAGDSGREGQVIIELIRRHGGVGENKKEKRVWIDSCTEEEILRGIKEAKDITCYDNLANAGIMRGIEDYAMGINFSRALSIKYGRMLNKAANNENYVAIAIGRVMTCVLGMVVRREREIREFTETPFFRVNGEVKESDTSITLEWKATETSEYFESPKLYKENGFKYKKDAEVFIDKLTEAKQGKISQLKKSVEKKKPPLLFNLAELQAECSKKFKISPEETLKVAQELYEKKLTTYPRTDARVLTTAIAKEMKRPLEGLRKYPEAVDFVEEILETKSYEEIHKSQYTDDKKVTDHYAIIPTGQTSGIPSLSPLNRKVYDLILRRFLSIFYPPAEYQKVNLTVDIAPGEEFSTSVKLLKNPGYLVVADMNSGKDNTENDNDDNNDNGDNDSSNNDSPDNSNEKMTKEEKDRKLLCIISNLKKGSILDFDNFSLKEGKTSPPKRYTSGSMVLAMENAGKLIEDEELRAQIKGAGIGTSATRAGIIDKLVRVGHLKLNTKTQVLTPENFGEMIFEVVQLTMPSMLNPEMTASWEKGLTGVEQGEITVEKYKEILDNYVRKHTENLKKMDGLDYVAKRIGSFALCEGYEKEGSADRHPIGVKCPVCGAEVETRPYGYACANYSREGCKFAIGLIAKKRLSEEQVVQLVTDGKLSNVQGFTSKLGKTFSANLVLNMEELEDGTKRPSVNFDFN